MKIGKVNGYFFQFDNTLHTRIFFCELLTLKSLTKASSVVLQESSLVELIGMESFLGKVEKKSTSALAYFDQYQLLG